MAPSAPRKHFIEFRNEQSAIYFDVTAKVATATVCGHRFKLWKGEARSIKHVCTQSVRRCWSSNQKHFSAGDQMLAGGRVGKCTSFLLARAPSALTTLIWNRHVVMLDVVSDAAPFHIPLHYTV